MEIKAKHTRKVLKFLFGRLFTGAIAVILQIALIAIMVIRFSEYFSVFYALNVLLSLIATLVVINNRTNPSYKITWIIVLLIAPVFGGIFYLLFAGNRLTKKEKARMKEIETHISDQVKQNREVVSKLKYENFDAYRQARYIFDVAKGAIFQNSKVTYLKSGEVYYKYLIEELKKAEKFIFMEYFIIQEGKMWNSILEVLEEKVKQGIDVRLIYDDIGSISTLSKNYVKIMESKGIKCIAFNKFYPLFLSSKMNNRDHRKLTSIDGRVGFTGGINLADEYINEKERFGYWKDNGVMIEGEAVWNITSLFLSIWDYLDTNNVVENYSKYKAINQIENDSFVSVYGTIPIINEPIGENIYLNLINRANKYIYITTPYLIIDNELVTALSNAAKMGMDVRIITPGIPDKKSVYMLTRSYYKVLIDNGVKIYEYTPGFLHAKTFVVDDIYATVGTVNLDYRSLYLHYECGAWMYRDKAIVDIKKDILNIIKDSKEITPEECNKITKVGAFKKAVLRMFAPLL